jgi:hypothetical protein
VAGTLGGVALTAAVSLLTALLVGRQQRAVVERRLQQEVGQKIREERRTTFVDYLAAYDAAMGCAYRVMISSTETQSSGTDRQRPFETIAEAEMGNVNKSYLTITITASAETREAARECTGALWKVGNAAMSGDKETFNREVENARGPRSDLRAAMRRELSVE